jgi:hypothetical protein
LLKLLGLRDHLAKNLLDKGEIGRGFPEGPEADNRQSAPAPFQLELEPGQIVERLSSMRFA